MSKKGLGRGLQALLPDDGIEPGALGEIELDLISPNPAQPRQWFDPQALEELAQSIREHGVIQPVIVQRQGDRYELVAGERRWRAAQMAGLQRIPAVVRDLAPAELVELALIENLQREDLNPIEQAEACQRLLDEFGLTHEQLSKRLGKSRPQITNVLRLLGLSAEIKQAIAAGKISMGHAKILLSVDDPAQRAALGQRIVAEGLSVRETEKAARQLQKKDAPAPKHLERTDPGLAAVEEKLRARLATRVRVRGSEKRGKIEIEYFSLEELNRILDAMLGQELA
ncbi:MAG TPA: ParB/RepB/Spo0J family partition protein [Firmicutes bacterium]|jgi:ParB family chromosome partitioning protein|nr:ParB/RepB/Spo0J family partition protein [Bacillota bacterium]